MDQCEEKRLLDWPHIFHARRIKLPPYDGTAVPVQDFFERQGDRRFLALSGGMSRCEYFGLHYLTPAGIDCPMRDAFETGEISWSDYWDTRDILICWEYSMYDASYVATRFCSTREFSPMARSHIDCKWSKCPLETKRDVLVNKVNIEKFRKRDSSVAEAEYESFMRVYERRMKKLAA